MAFDASTSNLTLGKYKAIIITPIVFTCVLVLFILLYRRRQRQKRERKAGVSRELNCETGEYELRPLPLARVRMGGRGGLSERLGVVRRAEEEGVPPPPSYGEAVAAVEGRLPRYEGLSDGVYFQRNDYATHELVRREGGGA